MKTKLKTIHEETYTHGEKSRIIGVLSNYQIDGNWNESFIYTYKDKRYVFFDTIIEMINYLLYGENDMERAYLEEETFDDLYDSNYINGSFRDHLVWIS